MIWISQFIVGYHSIHFEYRYSLLKDWTIIAAMKKLLLPLLLFEISLHLHQVQHTRFLLVLHCCSPAIRGMPAPSFIYKWKCFSIVALQLNHPGLC